MAFKRAATEAIAEPEVPVVDNGRDCFVAKQPRNDRCHGGLLIRSNASMKILFSPALFIFREEVMFRK